MVIARGGLLAAVGTWSVNSPAPGWRRGGPEVFAAVRSPVSA
ncbi:MAG TPA: hypothetical protein VK817_16865 [Trebonia sp.]|jgi:hypothetical protein|nr:hypothetical protein [Trebonia sp.]